MISQVFVSGGEVEAFSGLIHGYTWEGYKSSCGQLTAKCKNQILNPLQSYS